MALTKCADCGSARTAATTDYVSCMDCAAQTELDGTLRRASIVTPENTAGGGHVTGADSGVTTAAKVSTVETPEAPGDILDDLSKDELAAEAADRNIKGRSKMTKAELVAALRGEGA